MMRKFQTNELSISQVYAKMQMWHCHGVEVRTKKEGEQRAIHVDVSRWKQPRQRKVRVSWEP